MKKVIRHEYIFYMIICITTSAILFLSAYYSYTNNRSLILILILAIFCFIFVILATIVMIIDTIYLKTLKTDHLFIEKDISAIKEKSLAKMESNKNLVNKIIKYSLIILPLSLGIFVILGSLMDNVLFSMVIPGFMVSILLVFFIATQIIFSLNKWDDEFYIIKMKTIIIGDKYIYNQGKTYIFNKFGLKLKREKKIYMIYFKKIKLAKFFFAEEDGLMISEFLGECCEICD